MDWQEVFAKAHKWAVDNYQSNDYRYAAFGNSVAYLVTGVSGGSGPSIREHAVSWSLAGDGYNVPTETSLGTLIIQSPDGRLPMAGGWEFEKACEFAAPICFGQLPAIARKIIEQEYCFDDDPEDLKLLGK
jgi:hypothetical protein